MDKRIQLKTSPAQRILNFARIAFGYRGQAPKTSSTQLAPCPASPNCVCSVNKNPLHSIDSIPLASTPENAIQKFHTVISAMPNARITRAKTNYLHAEFTTKMMRFVDDLEILVNASTNTIQLRSASRVGYQDFGTNRKRVEHLRALFLAA